MTAEEWADGFIKVQHIPKGVGIVWGPGYDDDMKPLGKAQLCIQLAEHKHERDRVEMQLKAFLTDMFRSVQEDAIRHFAEEHTKHCCNRKLDGST
jgi:hypothetical protein